MEALALALVASAEIFWRLPGGTAFWTLATSVLEVAAAPFSALVTAGVASCILLLLCLDLLLLLQQLALLLLLFYC